MTDISPSPGLTLPAHIKVGKFAEGRIKEIRGLEAMLAQPRQGQLASQQIPRHLRRRAVSHHANRLPRRLRGRHLAQKDKSNQGKGEQKNKIPSRKHRRRTKNLLEEYNRRQDGEGKPRWMETHIWHAKRFHVNTKWGWKVPEAPTDKGFRAAYRAANNKTIMVDMSYYSCVELEGEQEKIVKGLKKVSRESGLLLAQEVLNGGKEGSMAIEGEKGFLGDVSFMWKPLEGENNRQLWMWIHPAFYLDVQEVLIKAFEVKLVAKEVKMEEDEIVEALPKKRKKDVEAMKRKPRNATSDKIPIFKNEGSGVEIRLLGGNLNRFRLVGPEASLLLAKTLRCSEVKAGSEEFWWGKYFKESSLRAHGAQQGFIQAKLGKHRTEQVESGVILGLTVRDPRSFLPKTKTIVNEKCYALLDSPLSPPSNCSQSPLWDASVRDAVTTTRRPDSEINALRSQLLIPGQQELALDDLEARIPILMVRTDFGSKERSSRASEEGKDHGRPTFGQGWDVILPAGWGMSFWVNLVYQGARVGASRELKHISLESRRLPPLLRAPDSSAGTIEASENGSLLREVHFKRPPDKRAQHIILGTPAPFSARWADLLKEYLQEDLIEKKKQNLGQICRTFSVLRYKEKLKMWHEETSAPHLKSEDKTLLLPVCVTIVGKGTIRANTMICLPKEQDLSQEEDGDHVEPNHNDQNEAKRKSLREKHVKEKARLRSDWKQKKEALQETRAKALEDKVETEEKVSEQLRVEIATSEVTREECNKSFNETMNGLWLLPMDSKVKDLCSRQLLGWCVEGATSFRIGKSVGLGFVPLVAYLEWLDSQASKEKIVLVRDPESSQYRKAKIEIVI